MSKIENASDTEIITQVLAPHKIHNPTMRRLNDFLPRNLVSKLSYYLGPGWDFHVEQELKSRDPAYIFFAEHPDHLLQEFTKKIIYPVSSLISDLVVGEGILNKDTRQALYNWVPSFWVRDILKEHPDWKVHCITIDGRPCVVNVGKCPNGFRGINIPHTATKDREEAYSAAILKMLGGIYADQWVCGDCDFKEKYEGTDAIPPIPKLSRCNAEPSYSCYEKFQHKCVRCNRKFVTSVGFN